MPESRRHISAVYKPTAQAVERQRLGGRSGAEEMSFECDGPGLVEQTLRNWVKAAKAGKLNPAGAKQITAEQMELSRLRAQVARLEMENEILKKAAAYFAKELL